MSNNWWKGLSKEQIAGMSFTLAESSALYKSRAYTFPESNVFRVVAIPKRTAMEFFIIQPADSLGLNEGWKFEHVSSYNVLTSFDPKKGCWGLKPTELVPVDLRHRLVRDSLREDLLK